MLEFKWTRVNTWLSLCILYLYKDFPGGSVVKNLPANAGDTGDPGSITGLGRSPGGWHGNPLQYSCLENRMDRGVWRATVHRVAKRHDWATKYIYSYDPNRLVCWSESLGGTFLGIPLLQILPGIIIGIYNMETTNELYGEAEVRQRKLR